MAYKLFYFKISVTKQYGETMHGTVIHKIKRLIRDYLLSANTRFHVCDVTTSRQHYDDNCNSL